MGRIDIFKVDNKFDEREREREREREGEREALAKNPHSFALLRFFQLCSPRPDDDLFTKSFFSWCLQNQE